MMARVQPAVYCLDSAEWMDGYSDGSTVGTYFFKPRRLASESPQSKQRENEVLRIHGIIASDHIRIPGELGDEAGDDEDARGHHVPFVGSVPARKMMKRMYDITSSSMKLITTTTNRSSFGKWL